MKHDGHWRVSPSGQRGKGALDFSSETLFVVYNIELFPLTEKFGHEIR